MATKRVRTTDRKIGEALQTASAAINLALDVATDDHSIEVESLAWRTLIAARDAIYSAVINVRQDHRERD